jgi:putative SOS response-associated peptidase YedK
LLEKPSFRGLFKKQRCLILADGFYEWKREGVRKIPYYIRLKSRMPFGFAGLWSKWIAPDESEIISCTIITGEPNELIKPIHTRMPTILRKTERELWLDPSNDDTEKLMSFLNPYPPDDMEAYPVSKAVNSPSNNSPECIQPVSSFLTE